MVYQEIKYNRVVCENRKTGKYVPMYDDGIEFEDDEIIEIEEKINHSDSYQNQSTNFKSIVPNNFFP